MDEFEGFGSKCQHCRSVYCDGKACLDDFGDFGEMFEDSCF